MDKDMRLGELTARAGVTARTVRYYEGLGLIPPGERSSGGQHRYPEETVVRLRKINQLKGIGLSLDEIREVIELYFVDPSEVLAKQGVLAILRRHLEDAEAKLESLGRYREDLRSRIEFFERWLSSHGS